MMDYNAAQEYLLGFTDYEKLPSVTYSAANYDLRRMSVLLEKLGNPHLKSRSVHITGTKGKGSTAAMIASVLSTSGYRTGLFTSPHLLTMRERIQINGQLISESELAAGVGALKPVVTSLMNKPQWEYGALTTFELLTALAFAYFAEKGVEYQVIEVGLGGRLDATNLVNPEVAVITSISLDHEDILGHTLEKIAVEKSGIIKSNIIVVSAPQEPEADYVLAQTCRGNQAKLVRVGTDVTWMLKSFTHAGQSVRIKGRKSEYELFIPLLGEYQLENAATAVAAIEALIDRGAQVTEENLKQGLARVSWPGRLQIIGRQPWLVIDGAHNPYSVKKLREALVKYFDYERLFVIMGTSIDKNIPGIAKELIAGSPTVIVSASQHPRATPAVRLAEEFAKVGQRVEIAPNIPAALTRARTLAKPSDIILVTGSLFVVAEAIKAIESEGKEGEYNAPRSR